MLILIPILLLILFAVTINLIGRYKLSIGSTWLITAGAALLVWILIIIYRVVMPGGISIDNWSPLGIGSDLVVFKLSTTTWVFAFLLVSLLIGVIFTDTVRLGQGNSLTTWTGSMVLTAVGLLSIFSQTLLAVIITWTLIDVVEFGILIRVISHPKVHSAAVFEFATRIVGTALIIGALVFSDFHSTISTNLQYSSPVFILILLGATLRLGVLPLHVPLTANLPIRRSLGTILRFVAPISVFSFLSQVHPQLQYSTVINILFPIALITAFYGAVRWLTSKNELFGRPYWMLAFSGLVLIGFLRGQVEGLIALSMIMVICGGFVFFHSYSAKYVTVMGVVCLVGMVGIPFTPVAPIWMSLMGSNQLNNALLVITFGLLIIGFLKHLSREGKKDSTKEIWMQLFYSIGLTLLVIVPWITTIWQSKDFQNSSKWSVPLICLAFICLLFLLMRSKFGQKFMARSALQRLAMPLNLIGKYIGAFFQFEWFFDFLGKLYDLISRPLRFFINILEGDGGLLWALLFLALISSVLVGKILPNG
jgi:hypothetical protein